MLSHQNQHSSKRPLKHTSQGWIHRYRLIHMLAGSCVIAGLSLLLFKGKENVPIVFPQKDTAFYTTQSDYQLNKQSKVGEIPQESQRRRIEVAELQTGLYDLEGNLLGKFLGDFQETTPNGQGVITYAHAEGRSYVSPLDGTEPTALSGIFQGFTPSGQQLITYHRNQSHLHDLNGTPIAKLEGLLRWGTLDGQYLVTEIGNGQSFNLYSVDGTLQAEYEGAFHGFALYTPQLITTDRIRSYLYNFDGTLASTFEGEFQEFSPNGESLITQTNQFTQPANRPTELLTNTTSQSHLYGLDGTLQASMTGEFAAFTAIKPTIEAGIITSNRQSLQSWLYNSNGVQESALEGSFIAFTPDGQSFFTYSDGTSHLYRLDSNFIHDDYSSYDSTHFEGVLLGITTNAQQLVTAGSSKVHDSPQSWLYNIDGTKIANLDGIFVGFISDEQRIVTSRFGVEDLLWLTSTTYSIYNLTGDLQATLTGQLLGLTQSGRQGLVMYADGKTTLYDSFDGTERAVFEGSVLGFTRDETGVFLTIEDTAEEN